MDKDLEKLREQIEAAKVKIQPEIETNSANTADDDSLKKLMRIGTDVIGTPIVCAAIGMGLDSWFSTAPFLFLTMAFLGVFAGFWNLYRAQIGADSAVGFKRLRSAKKQGRKAQFLEKNTSKNDPTP